eukprot:1836046-Amphidinium_carterae.1
MHVNAAVECLTHPYPAQPSPLTCLLRRSTVTKRHYKKALTFPWWVRCQFLSPNLNKIGPQSLQFISLSVLDSPCKTRSQWGKMSQSACIPSTCHHPCTDERLKSYQ